MVGCCVALHWVNGRSHHSNEGILEVESHAMLLCNIFDKTARFFLAFSAILGPTVPFTESCLLPSLLQILDDAETENGQTLRKPQNSDTIDQERHQTVGQRPCLWKIQSRSQALVEPNTTMERPAHLRFGKYRPSRGSKGQSSKLTPNCHQSNTSRPIKHPIIYDIYIRYGSRNGSQV